MKNLIKIFLYRVRVFHPKKLLGLIIAIVFGYMLTNILGIKFSLYLQIVGIALAVSTTYFVFRPPLPSGLIKFISCLEKKGKKGCTNEAIQKETNLPFHEVIVYRNHLQELKVIYEKQKRENGKEVTYYILWFFA